MDARADDVSEAAGRPLSDRDAGGDSAEASPLHERPSVRGRLSRRFARRAPRRDYDAFISYSHADDAKVAAPLQTALQGFARPWYRLRSLRVFRDTASLSASSALWSAIQQALESSRFFLLLASPESASRAWIEKEVAWWRERKSVDALLIVLTGGEIVWVDGERDFDWERTTALPRPLRGAFAEEPLFVDLRVVREAAQVSTRHPALREAVATLSAAILGRPRDELIGEDIKRHRRAMRVAAGAVAAIACFAAIAAWQWRAATHQRDRAREEAAIALSRQLAAQSFASLDESSVLGVLLGIEAYRTVEQQTGPQTFDARSSMLAALERDPRAIWILPLVANSLAFASDGRTLAVAGEDRTVQLWDAVRGVRLGRPLRGHTDAVSTVAFSSDGAMLASGGRDSTILVWSVPKRAVLYELRGHTNIVTNLAFSPDGTRLASADGREIRLWTLGEPLARSKILNGSDGFAEAVAFSPDGNTLASAGDEGVLRWDVQHRRRSQRVSGESATGRFLQTIAFSPDGTVLVAGGSSGILFWDVGARIRLRGHRAGDVRSVSFSADGTRVVSGHGDGSVRFWDVRTASPLGRPLRGHTSSAWSVAWSPRGTIVASASFDATVRIWRARGQPPLSQSAGSGGLISALTFASGGTLVSANDHGMVRRWAGPHLHHVSADVVIPADSWGTALSPGGGVMAVVTAGGALLFSRTTGRRGTVARRRFGVRAIAFRQDGARLVTASSDGTVRVWDVRTKKPVARVRTEGEGGPVAFGPAGQIVAARGDGAITVWDVGRERQLHELVTEHSGPILDLASSPDGRLLASAGLDGTIRLWDLETAHSLGEPLRGHKDAIFDLAFSPDGSALVSGSRDGTVRLWDIARRSELGQPLSAGDQVAKVAFSPDGRSVASGGVNGVITVWRNVLPGTAFSVWRDRLCPVAQRNMTRSEWQEFLPAEAYRTTCPQFPSRPGT